MSEHSSRVHTVERGDHEPSTQRVANLEVDTARAVDVPAFVLDVKGTLGASRGVSSSDRFTTPTICDPPTTSQWARTAAHVPCSPGGGQLPSLQEATDSGEGSPAC